MWTALLNMELDTGTVGWVVFILFIFVVVCWVYGVFSDGD